MAKNKKQAKNSIKKTISELMGYYMKEAYVPFGIFIFISILLNGLISLDVFPNFFRIYISLAAVVFAGILAYWTFKTMQKAGEDWQPHLIEAQRFIVTGPYQYTQNPMFIVCLMIYVALFIFLNNVWGLILAYPLAKTLSKHVIRPKEKAMLEMYGENYDIYRRRTPRWF